MSRPRRAGPELGEDHDDEEVEHTPERSHDGVIETVERPPKAVLMSVVPSRVDDDHFDELRGLCDTAGIEPVDELLQVRGRPTPGLYLGKGKAEELAELVELHDAELVVCDEELAPVQARNLEKLVKARVLDRSELILVIFAENARTSQARLQVELARMQYELPRLRRLWTHLDRERGARGAIGGMGERQIEIDRRLVKKRITAVRKRLVEIEARKQREIHSRRQEFQVSLVGYTNAGKSTLMNALTGSDILAEDRLFATLDTRTRKWQLGEGRFVLLSDTVGFVRRLPHQLIASFHATLAEALEADLLLLLVDLTSGHPENQMETVIEVLDEVGASGKDSIQIFNKTDACDPGLVALMRNHYPDALFVSAATGDGLERLADAVRERLDRVSEHCWLAVAHKHSAVLSDVRTLTTVHEVRYGTEATFFHVHAPPSALERLRLRGVEVLANEPDVG